MITSNAGRVSRTGQAPAGNPPSSCCAGTICRCSFGYNRLLEESSNLLLDLKEVTTATGLSMTDKERLDIINRIYGEVLEYKNLTWYYTRKNIGISYLRSKKKGDSRRVLALYGTHDQRYW